jgi:hypothetical protein
MGQQTSYTEEYAIVTGRPGNSFPTLETGI